MNENIGYNEDEFRQREIESVKELGYSQDYFNEIGLLGMSADPKCPDCALGFMEKYNSADGVKTYEEYFTSVNKYYLIELDGEKISNPEIIKKLDGFMEELKNAAKSNDLNVFQETAKRLINQIKEL